MAIRHRTVIRQEQTFAAGDAPIIDNLPVNGISFVDVTIRVLQSVLNTLPTVGNVLSVLSRIEILFKGSSLISIDPNDHFILQQRMGWLTATMPDVTNLANAVRRLTLRISLSRVPFWAKEGFPPSRAGELQIRYTPAAAFTNVVTASLNVEVEELFEVQFANFLKYTTISRTPSATGESDVFLPLGNKYAGILLFGTTVPTGVGVTASMREVRLLIDNQEDVIVRTRWDTLHADMQSKIDPWVYREDHTHLENLAGVYTQNVATAAPNDSGIPAHQYAFLDFDPLKDDNYLVDTGGRSEVKLRINADVADAQRIIPIEMVALAAAAPR